jgi:hypothetical protein
MPYTSNDLQDAVLAYTSPGNKLSMAAIGKSKGIPSSTLSDAVNRHRGQVELKASGPKKLMPDNLEQDLVDWVFAMQAEKQPITPDELFIRANRIIYELHGRYITKGWYQKFLKRHPELSRRKAQSISKARNQVTDSVIDEFYDKIRNAVEMVNMDPSRIFNMDETGFLPKRHSQVVLAETGSSNVWAQQATANFHMSIVGCIGAGGKVIPPLFILPGLSVEFATFEKLTIAESAIATTSSGFINSYLFKLWLTMFSESIPHATRLILLVFDGCSSHYSSEIFDEAEKLQILLFRLPPNATHLFQPLDVGVFKSLKNEIRRQVTEVSRLNSSGNISKQMAVEIGCRTWQRSLSVDLCVRAFEATGVFPLQSKICVIVLVCSSAVVKRQHVFKQVGFCGSAMYRSIQDKMFFFSHQSQRRSVCAKQWL